MKRKFPKGYSEGNFKLPLPEEEKEEIIYRFQEAGNYYSKHIEQKTGVSLQDIRIEKVNNKLDRRMDLKKEDKEKSLAIYYPDHKLISPCFGEKMRKKWYYEKTKKLNPQWIDELIVHELTHGLFENLGGSDYFIEGLEVLTEGYAMYGEIEWFKEFYPSQTFKGKLFSNPKEYIKGFRMISNLVTKYGKEILFDLPKNWKKYKEVNKKWK